MNPNKRYGLIIPKKDAEKKKPSISSVFGDDSSDSDKDTSTDWKRKALQSEAKKSVKRQTQLEMDRALAEDPTVYQYDEIYDEIEKKKTDKVSAKRKEDKKPRYIQSLLKQAEKRKQENERRNERQVQKDREREGGEFGDKETFVTSSYRKKLEEFKKLDEEERRMDMLEEIGDVSKQQDLGGFYRHLYQTTVAEDENKDKVYKKPEFEFPDKKSSDKMAEAKSEVSCKSAEVEKKLPEKSSRSYRKRKNSGSSDEEGSPKKNKTSKKKDENPDADTSNSSSSENEDGGGSEEGEIIDKNDDNVKRKEEKRKKPKSHKKEDDKKEGDDRSEETKEVNLEDQVKSSLDKILEEKKKHLEKLIKEEEEKENTEKDTEKEENVEKVKEKKKKVNIWEKRTVGEVFDAALKRYLERKANREAMSG